MEHGVGNVAHTRLQRQEFFRDASGAELADEEFANVCTDAHCCLVDRREAVHLVGVVGFYDANDFRRVDFQHRRTDAVAWLIDGNLAAVRRIERHVDVVQTADFSRDMLIELNYNLVGKVSERRDVAHTRTEQNFAVVGHVASLDYHHVHLAEESVAEVLRKLREVHVAIVDFVSVEACAGVFA